MNILGISWEHCATAALAVNGEVVACTSEERFSRRKNDDRYPRHAIEACLEIAGLAPSDLDLVAMAGERFDATWTLCHRSAFTIQDRLREQREIWYPRLYEKRDVGFLDVFRDKIDAEQFPGRWDDVLAFLRNGAANDVPTANAFFQEFRRRAVSQHLGIDPARVVFPHHHRSHAYYAYFASPVDRVPVLILTADAWGDDMNASVSVADSTGVRRLHASANFELARLYRSMTLLLGMKPDEHEYKVMGLAAYAKPQYLEGPLEVFRATQYVDGLGFAYWEQPPDRYLYFQKKLEGHRFDAIAGALQRYTEEVLAEWTANALKATGAARVCFGGGMAMNVKAMMELARLPGVEDLFVCPSPSDESLPMGACYAAAYDAAAPGDGPARTRLKPIRDAYLGGDLDTADVRAVVEDVATDGRYEVREGVAATDVARLLASGRIIGRCTGRSEFGARALGNRSILADPRDIDVVTRINEKVKSRDFWMPFAPSIIEERAPDYLVNPKGLRAPFMTIAFHTTPLAHRDLRAALHPADRTARPQIVTRAANPSYHALIAAFERLTGVGGLLNTSFNIHGEPIVQTPADAVDVLRRCDLDALILGDYLICKR